MNKKGQTLFVGLMLAVILFIIGLALAPALKDVTGEARDDPQLNCSNSSISDETKATCTSIDIQQLFIPVIFGIAGLIVWKVVL